MKKKIISITIMIVFSFAPVYSAVDSNECDALKTKAKKIDCLSALKAQAIKEGALKPLKKINIKINALEEKKINFDKENKTLWGMWKNRNK